MTNLAEEPIKVLVVDDEGRLCMFLEDGLSHMGCRVKTALNGEKAVEMIRAQTFDVVVCDIMMPGSGGIWTLETIKENWPMTEVIMMTGYATAESAEVCKALGAFGFLTKPFELDDLRLAIGKAMETRQLRLASLGTDPERTVDVESASSAL